MKKKKQLTAAAALGTAAILTLGGTFAWQSISQTALNEASDIVNPGGRLHDDFDGSNKDIYVENFADDEIFARVQLAEYFKVIMNYGVEGAEVQKDIVGSEDADGNIHYEIYKFDDKKQEDGTFQAAVQEGTPFWTWSVGGKTAYMPTFNKNKDSLVADINGIYEEGNVGTISNRDGTQYTEYTDWSAYEDGDGTIGVGAKLTGTEIYDGDTNTADEVGKDFENLADYADNIVTAEAEHTVSETQEAQLISITEWLAMVDENGGEYDPEQHGNYWVYDQDGWVYWSAPIAAHSATGCLLTGIELNQIMDDTWYYAIDVTAQFVTADDVGQSDGTGFYDALTSGISVVDEESAAEPAVPVSADAEKLLKLIGVQIDVNSESGSGGTDTGEKPVWSVMYLNDMSLDSGWYVSGTEKSIEASIRGSYMGEDGRYHGIEDKILAKVTWTLSGNTSEDTTLNTNVGKTVTLSIAADETGEELKLVPTLTYGGQTDSNEWNSVKKIEYEPDIQISSRQDYFMPGEANELEIYVYANKSQYMTFSDKDRPEIQISIEGASNASTTIEAGESSNSMSLKPAADEKALELTIKATMNFNGTDYSSEYTIPNDLVCGLELSEEGTNSTKWSPRRTLRLIGSNLPDTITISGLNSGTDYTYDASSHEITFVKTDTVKNLLRTNGEVTVTSGDGAYSGKVTLQTDAYYEAYGSSITWSIENEKGTLTSNSSEDRTYQVSPEDDVVTLKLGLHVYTRGGEVDEELDQVKASAFNWSTGDWNFDLGDNSYFVLSDGSYVICSQTLYEEAGSPSSDEEMRAIAAAVVGKDLGDIIIKKENVKSQFQFVYRVDGFINDKRLSSNQCVNLTVIPPAAD